MAFPLQRAQLRVITSVCIIALCIIQLGDAVDYLASPTASTPFDLTQCTWTHCSLEYLLKQPSLGVTEPVVIRAEPGTYTLHQPFNFTNAKISIISSTIGVKVTLDFWNNCSLAGWQLQGTTELTFNDVEFTRMAAPTYVRVFYLNDPDTRFICNDCSFTNSRATADATIFMLRPKSQLEMNRCSITEMSAYQFVQAQNATVSMNTLMVKKNDLVLITAVNNSIARVDDAFYYHNHPNFNFTHLTPFYVNASSHIYITNSIFFMNQFGRNGFLTIATASAATVDNVTVDTATSLGPLVVVLKLAQLFISNTRFVNNTADSQIFLKGGNSPDQRCSMFAVNMTCFGNEGPGGCLTVGQCSAYVNSSAILYNHLSADYACGSAIATTHKEANIVIRNSTIQHNTGGIAAICTTENPCCSQSSELTILHSDISMNDITAETSYCYTTCSTLSCMPTVCDCGPNRGDVVSGCINVDRCTCDSKTTKCNRFANGTFECACLPEYPIRVDNLTCAYNGLNYTTDPLSFDIRPLDKSECDMAHPCALDFLLSTLRSGDSITLQPGVYAMNQSLSTNIRILNRSLYLSAASTTEPTILDFSGIKSSWEIKGAWSDVVQISGITIANLSTTFIDLTSARLYFINSHITTSRLDTAAITTTGSASVNFERSTITHIVPLTTNTVTSSNGPDRVFIFSYASNAPATITFLQSQFSNNAIAFAYLNGANFNFYNGGINNNTISGLSLGSGKSVVTLTTKGYMKLRNSQIKNNLVSKSFLSVIGARFSWENTTVANTTSHESSSIIELSFEGAGYIDGVDFVGSIGGPPVRLKGNSELIAVRFSCRNSFSWGCIDSIHSRVKLDDSLLTNNTNTNEEDCTIFVSDEGFSTFDINNSTITYNSGGVGVFCIVDANGCPSHTSMIQVFNTKISDNDVTKGGLIFFASPSALPACANSVGLYNNSLIPGANPGPEKASYPHKMLPPSVLSPFRPPSDGGDLHFTYTMQIGDFWSQPVSESECVRFPLCLTTSSEKLIATKTTNLTCTPGKNVIKVEFIVRAPVEPATYTAEFTSCPSLPSLSLQPTYTAQFEIISEPKGTTSAAVIVGVVVVSVVLLILTGFFIYIYTRRKRRFRLRAPSTRELNKPLLMREGVMMTDSMTMALEEAKIPVVDPEDIEIIDTVGVGATGVVVLGKWLSRNETLVAVKQVSTANLVGEGWSETRKAHIKELITEIQVMISVNHPNLLPLLGCCVINDTDIRLITPFMQNRSLAMHIETLDNKKVIPIIRQIAFAIDYLHLKNLVHRDLKPENILLDENWTVFVGDFAMSKILSTATQTAAVVGTPAYMAPEVIISGEGSPASDTYSFGVVALELLTKERVFKNLRGIAIMHKVANEGLMPTVPDELLNDDTRPAWIPKDVVLLVQRCLHREPEERPTFKEICDTLKQY